MRRVRQPEKMRSATRVCVCAEGGCAHLDKPMPLLVELSTLCVHRAHALAQVLPLVHACLLSSHEEAFSCALGWA